MGKVNKMAWGHMVALFTVIVWGTTFVSTKVLLNDFNAVEIMVFRFLLAYIALWIIRPKTLKLKRKIHEVWFALAGLMGVTLYFLFENIALTYTSASNAAIIISITPMFTAVMVHFTIKDERIKPNFVLGFVVAIVGIVLVTFNGNFVLKLNPLGDILCIGAALVWGVYSVYIKKISIEGYDTLLCTRRIFLYGLIFIIPAGMKMGVGFDIGKMLVPSNGLNLLYLGLCASAFCYILWNYAIDVIGVNKTSVYLYGMPLVTILSSALILGEKITVIGMIGAILTIVGLFISERK